MASHWATGKDCKTSTLTLDQHAVHHTQTNFGVCPGEADVTEANIAAMRVQHCVLQTRWCPTVLSEDLPQSQICHMDAVASAC